MKVARSADLSRSDWVPAICQGEPGSKGVLNFVEIRPFPALPIRVPFRIISFGITVRHGRGNSFFEADQMIEAVG
jgi:hypothetical protein